LAIGRASANQGAADHANTLQDAILRYGRVPLCATLDAWLQTQPRPLSLIGGNTFKLLSASRFSLRKVLSQIVGTTYGFGQKE
jgi:hypothetical protein